jgi:hypothetical protein
MTDDHNQDEAAAIEMAEQVRAGAKAARAMFNAYLAEGFTEAQSLALTRTAIHAASGGTDA